MVLDNLAVSITSQVADVKAGISSVRGSFVDLAGTAQGTAGRLDETSDEMDELTRSTFPLIASTQILQGRLDEAGDEARNLGFQSGFAASLVTTLGFSSEGAALGVTALSTSLTLALIPAVLTLATILAPLTATLGVLAGVAGGLGGAFGLIIGSGIIAGFERLRDTATESLELIRAQLFGFGQAFVPLLDGFLRELPNVTREILSSVGDLDPFVAALEEIGGIAADALPEIASGLADLGRDALPTLVSVVRTIAEDGPGAFRLLQRSANDAIPVLQSIGQALIENGPALLEFGTNVLELVGPALVDLINLGGQVLGFVNNLTPNLRNLTIGLAALAPVIVGLVSLLGGPFTAAFIGVLALVAAWEDDFLGVRTTIMGVVGDVTDAFGGFKDFLSQVFADSMDELNGFVRAAVDGFNALIRGLNDFIREANKLPGVDFGLLETIATPQFAQTGTAQFSQRRQQQRQQIEVLIQSDDEKFDAEVRDISSDEFGRMNVRQADRADRNRPI